VASFADEIKRRTGEETIVSDFTYDLRSGDPDFIDKLVAMTFGSMAYDAILEGKTGLMSALVEGRYDLVPPNLRRSRSHSAIHNGPFTLDVLLELNNDELLITDYAFDKIAD
jgi:6-phosphofructokinase